MPARARPDERCSDCSCSFLSEQVFAVYRLRCGSEMELAAAYLSRQVIAAGQKEHQNQPEKSRDCGKPQKRA